MSTKNSRLSGRTNMGHVGLENDMVPPEHLKVMARQWHYGWQWSGQEPDCGVCGYGRCGLVIPDPTCTVHRKLGAAKQLHKAVDCPGDG